ncbi:MAG: type II secretion system protein [Planctomycetota bacterium]|nr:MAG: type II secretion system protein [Planctomycetota bacterium]REJ98589.1 MAG: type II secretion system protein [Planctomycetota bacterium]REK29889.1 MAG: type II secretion system protein [Planctomycetota bacterium]REK47941.1 MAG: type II secretion system protein [Planctomycetota bacterium]
MKNRKTALHRKRRGFSLLELLAVVTILGIIAVVIIPRINFSRTTAETNANLQNIAEINSAVERYFFETGTWPASNLSDIGANANYFPDGIPAKPGGGNYTLDSDHRAQ